MLPPMRPVSCARLSSGVSRQRGGGVGAAPSNAREAHGILAHKEDVPPGTRAAASYPMHHASPSVAQEDTGAHPKSSPRALRHHPSGAAPFCNVDPLPFLAASLSTYIAPYSSLSPQSAGSHSSGSTGPPPSLPSPSLLGYLPLLPPLLPQPANEGGALPLGLGLHLRLKSGPLLTLTPRDLIPDPPD